MFNPITIIISLFALFNVILGSSTFYYYHLYIDAVQFKDQVRQQQEYTKLVKHEYDIKLEDTINKHNADVKRMREQSKTSILPIPQKPDETEICFNREQLDSAIQQYRSGIQELISIGSESQIDLDNARNWAENFNKSQFSEKLVEE